MPTLELDIKERKSDKGLSFTVQIIEQRLRGGNANFVASNGFYFSSLSCPAIGVGYNSSGSSKGMLYLRGSGRREDNAVLYTDSIGYIEKLKEAVLAYNIAKEDIV